MESWLCREPYCSFSHLSTFLFCQRLRLAAHHPIAPITGVGRSATTAAMELVLAVVTRSQIPVTTSPGSATTPILQKELIIRTAINIPAPVPVVAAVVAAAAAAVASKEMDAGLVGTAESVSTATLTLGLVTSMEAVPVVSCLSGFQSFSVCSWSLRLRAFGIIVRL